VKELFKRPLFLALFCILVALLGLEVATLRFSLAQRLISTDDAVRNKALSELPAIGPDKRPQLISELIKQQQNAKPKPKRYAFYAIRVLGGKSTVVINALVDALGENDPHVRMESQQSLLEMGEPALPAVAAAAKSGNDVVRENALYILEKSGSAGVDLLTPMLTGPAARVAPIVQILGRMGDIAKPAVPALIALFNSPDADLRLDAALVANNIERPAPEALPVFMKALKDRPWDNKSVEIVRALEDMGSAAQSAAPELTKMMMQSKENFADPQAPRAVLAQALSELDPRRSELVDLGFDLRQKAPALRYRAAYALSVMDPPNVGAVESLVGSLRDPDVTVLARVLVALKRIGLDKTERFGAAAKIKAAEARVQAAHIEGFSAVY
jgi:HEAT repeat protein